MKDFFGNEIKTKPDKFNVSYPNKTLHVCRIILLALSFFWVHTLRPLPIAKWDLKVRVKQKGQYVWQVMTYNIATKTECEADKDRLRIMGYTMECFMRYVK